MGSFNHCLAFYRGECRRNANQSFRAIEAVYTYLLEHQQYHLLCHVVIRDGPVAKRAVRLDVTGGAPYHMPCFVAYGKHFVAIRFERDDRRLVIDDVLASGIDESVRCAEVDSEIAYQGSAPVWGKF